MPMPLFSWMTSLVVIVIWFFLHYYKVLHSNMLFSSTTLLSKMLNFAKIGCWWLTYFWKYFLSMSHPRPLKCFWSWKQERTTLLLLLLVLENDNVNVMVVYKHEVMEIHTNQLKCYYKNLIPHLTKEWLFHENMANTYAW